MTPGIDLATLSSNMTVSSPSSALQSGVAHVGSEPAFEGGAALDATSESESAHTSDITALGRSSLVVESELPHCRVIKRYSNRKLYDTRSSRYVTLPQIAELVRSGERVQIVDNRTKEDKTEITLALIISEELRVSPRGIPLETLTALIQRRGIDTALHGLSAPFRYAPPPSDLSTVDLDANLSGEFMTDSHDRELRARFEAWCAAVDSRMSTLPDPAKISGLEAEVRRLNDRLTELERTLEAPRE